MYISNILGVFYVLDRKNLRLSRDKDINEAIRKALAVAFEQHKAVRAVDNLDEITAIFSGMKRARAFCGRMTAGGRFYGVVKNA